MAAVGLPLPLTPEVMHRMFRLEVAHITTCPVLFGLTMGPPEKILFCLGEAKADSRRIGNFCDLLEGAPVTVDLAMGPSDKASATPAMPAEERMEHAAKLLDARGLNVGQHRLLAGTGAAGARAIDEYGMVAPPINRGTPKDSPWLAMLSLASTSILIC